MSLSAKQLGVYLSLLVIGGGAGVVGSRYLESPPQTRENSAIPAALQPFPRSPTPVPANNINFIAQAVEQVGPAVVRIDAARTVSQDIPESFKHPLFKRFFGDEVPLPEGEERLERGTGSGFILSEDGQLITNAHVVEGSDTVKVTLKDGRVFDGRVVGTDSVTDIAVIKIEAEQLPTVKLGSSKQLTPGEWAIAIGNPLGLDNTVTVGIISALGRSSSEVGVPNKRVSFIQTDAAINPGNSGGPLLNAKGEVIGINTAIRRDAQGLGFSIPIETATRIANQLMATGKVEHPYLGIQMVTLNSEIKEELNKDSELNFTVKEDRGVLIVQVMANSPAKKAGFRPGDIIKTVGGYPVQTGSDVQQRVDLSEIGEVLDVEVIRNNKLMTVQVRPIASPL